MVSGILYVYVLGVARGSDIDNGLENMWSMPLWVFALKFICGYKDRLEWHVDIIVKERYMH